MSSRDAPWCPPIVEMSSGLVGHLLAWEMHEHDGTWHAWVSWIQQAGGRHVHKVVDVRAGSLQPLEAPDAYSAVPRRVRGSDGLIRPWSGESGLAAGIGGPVWHLDDHDQVWLLDQPELEHLQRDQPGLRMIDPDRRGPEVADRIFGPPLSVSAATSSANRESSG